MRSLEQKDASFSWADLPDVTDDDVRESVLEAISHATADRIHSVQRGLAAGLSAEEVFDACEIDPWYLDQIQLINEVAAYIRDADELDEQVLRVAKNHGFSDEQIAALRRLETGVVTGIRHALRVRPVFKTVDTCAGEFEAKTPYHYSSYDSETEVMPRDRPAVIILGSGPNRIGQGIEFDYSCVHATMAIGSAGFETIMVNCNPETVSTDYDTADRLYFEPLTFEDVMEVYHAELAAGEVLGVVCTLGGQTPLGLADKLKAPACPCSAPSPRPSTWPRTAENSAPSSTGPDSPHPSTAPR